MTMLTAFMAAMLGTTLATAAPAGYRDDGPISSLRRHNAATGTSERAPDDALGHIFDHNGAHGSRIGTCGYPNYYGLYPNYYIGADGRGHFCDSWTPSYLSR